jgi:hypothetical protein
MTSNLTSTTRRKPPFSLVLKDDLEAFLRAKAGAGYRSLTKEITMRLELSRKLELQAAQKGAA